MAVKYFLQRTMENSSFPVLLEPEASTNMILTLKYFEEILNQIFYFVSCLWYTNREIVTVLFSDTIFYKITDDSF